MKVRAARIEDAGRIAEIHVRAWQRAYAGLIPAAVLDGLSIAARESSWKQRLRSGEATVIVAELDGVVVGWLAWGRSRDADALESVAEIYGLYVDPTHWGRGAGTTLCTEAERRLAASSFDRVTLWVLEGNDRARRFYELVGFRLEPERVKMAEWEGTALPELRYARPVPVDSSGTITALSPS